MKNVYNNNFTFLNIAIAIFFLATPIESIALFENFSIAKLSALIVLLGWLTQRFNIRQSTMIQSFIVLAIYAFLSILWSIDSENTFHQVLLFLLPSIIVASAINYSIRSKRDIFLYLIAFIIGCLIAVIATLLSRGVTLSVAEYADQERLTAFNQDQNTLAFLLCVGITILLDFYRHIKKAILRYTCLVMSIVFVVAILSTGSRTGLILTILVFGIYLLASGSVQNFCFTILILLLVSPLIYNYIPESIWERFSEINQLVDNGDFSDRGNIWSFGLKAFTEENIFLGVGYSNFSTMLKQHYGWHMASHNTYLSYLVDLGVVGFIIFFFVLFRMINIVYQLYKCSNDIYIFAYIIPFLAVMFVLETEYKRWLFILGVMLESYYRINYLKIRTKFILSNENITSNTYSYSRGR